MLRAIHSYLALRRSLGYRLVETGQVLERFAGYARGRREAYVRACTAVEWAGQGPSERERWNRLRTIACFARHVHAEDPRHEIPVNVFPHRQNRRIPYIFRPEQVRRLLSEARALGPSGSLRPHTYVTLIGLLAVTGLRISEALHLTFDDLLPDGLFIRETKFKKSRLVPLHRTTQVALENYLARRRRFSTDDAHVFISHIGLPLPARTVGHVFRRLLKRAGIDRGPGRRGPVIHDFRHTFCVRALLRCPEGREAVAENMLAVSTYMGHSAVASTYWYLEGVPTLMSDIARACERRAEGGSR